MTAIEVARKVTAEKQAHLFRPRSDGQYDAKAYVGGSKRTWVLLDLFSAEAIVAVHDSLKKENQLKYGAMPIEKMAVVAFKLLK